jgi:hypothetical protein
MIPDKIPGKNMIGKKLYGTALGEFRRGLVAVDRKVT